MKLEDLKPGDHFMVATAGMRGHFACEFWLNNEQEEFTFPEPWQSDYASFATREEAVTRAKAMAEEMKLPYIE